MNGKKRGGDADDRKQSCTISDYVGSGGRENRKEIKMAEHRRLIDADELMNHCRNTKDGTIDCNDIARFPTVDVESVRHGRWEDFEEGEYIIYVNGDNYELGRIKTLQEDGAFVAYHEGETGAKTPYDTMHKLINNHVIEKTSLGGEYFKE